MVGALVLRRSFTGSIRLSQQWRNRFQTINTYIKSSHSPNLKEYFWLSRMFSVYTLYLNGGLPKGWCFLIPCLNNHSSQVHKTILCYFAIYEPFITFTHQNWNVLFKEHVNCKNESSLKPALLSTLWILGNAGFCLNHMNMHMHDIYCVFLLREYPTKSPLWLSPVSLPNRGR